MYEEAREEMFKRESAKIREKIKGGIFCGFEVDENNPDEMLVSAYWYAWHNGVHAGNKGQIDLLYGST